MMIFNIKAVAFDIDGTLYADWRLYLRMVPYFFKHLSFFIMYKKVRKMLHKNPPVPNFFEYQADLFAKVAHISSDEAFDCIQRIVYQGLQPFFKKIKPYAGLEEALKTFKNNGLKLALLSDFPPEQKGDLWGLRHYFLHCLGTEKCGALKPSAHSFQILAEKLELHPSQILYVGNSIFSDIRGAKNVGMRAAYIMPLWRKILRKKLKISDICFNNYRQLCKIVLQ